MLFKIVRPIRVAPCVARMLHFPPLQAGNSRGGDRANDEAQPRLWRREAATETPAGEPCWRLFTGMHAVALIGSNTTRQKSCFRTPIEDRGQFVGPEVRHVVATSDLENDPTWIGS